MPFDPEDYRAESRDRWDRGAEGWGAQADRLGRATANVASWMIDAIGVQPGQTLLELAAGPGDVGLMAAELVRPGGKVIATDGSEAMVEVLRRRAAERGLDSVVEAKVMEAEWIDLGAATVDGVLCRWGYMLLADPGAALTETRRVLRPGGAVALAAWDGAERNRWSSVPQRELVRRGLRPAPDPEAPGQFAWADRSVIAERLEEAGFTDVRVETLEWTLDFADLDEWWDTQLDLSLGLREAVAEMTPEARDELREALDEQLAEHVAPDGRVSIPAATHVAVAEA